MNILLLGTTIAPIRIIFLLLDAAHTSNLVARDIASPQVILWVITSL